MRSSSSSLARLLMTRAGLALLWLLVPSIASAALAPRRAAARLCNAHTITLHKLARIAASFNGPVAPAHRARTHTLSRLSSGGVRLERGAHPASTDDDVAIQNETPAPWSDAGVAPAFALEPIGVLARTILRPPTTPHFSPRSPRGPPVAD